MVGCFQLLAIWPWNRQVSKYIHIYQSGRYWWFHWICTELPESSTGVVQALHVVCFPQFYAVLEVSRKQVLMQLESHAQTTDRRMERIKGLLQTFIGSPQMTSVLIGSIYLVDATHKKHSVPMNMAQSLEVHLYAWCISWGHLVIGLGNPWVIFTDPYPYPCRPIPVKEGYGYSRVGVRGTTRSMYNRLKNKVSKM